MPPSFRNNYPEDEMRAKTLEQKPNDRHREYEFSENVSFRIENEWISPYQRDLYKPMQGLVQMDPSSARNIVNHIQKCFKQTPEESRGYNCNSAFMGQLQ